MEIAMPKSLTECAYQLCKDVLNNAAREELRQIVSAFAAHRKTDEPDKGSGNINFGHFAARQHAQFLGFLLVDGSLASIRQRLPDMPELTPGQRKALELAYVQILYLYRECVQWLPPKVRLSVDPYSNFEYSVREVDGRENNFLFSSPAADVFASNFKLHRAYGIACEGVPKDIDRMSREKIESIVRAYSEDFLKGERAEEVTEMIYRIDRGSAKFRAFRYIMSLVSLRASLYTVCQMVYQATYQERLYCFDEENIVSYSTGGNIVREVIRLRSYMDGSQFGIRSGDLAYLNLDDGKGYKRRGLHEVRAINHNFDKETGWSMGYELIPVDDELSPFSRLVLSVDPPVFMMPKT